MSTMLVLLFPLSLPSVYLYLISAPSLSHSHLLTSHFSGGKPAQVWDSVNFYEHNDPVREPAPCVWRADRAVTVYGLCLWWTLEVRACLSISVSLSLSLSLCLFLST